MASTFNSFKLSTNNTKIVNYPTFEIVDKCMSLPPISWNIFQDDVELWKTSKYPFNKGVSSLFKCDECEVFNTLVHSFGLGVERDFVIHNCG